VRDGAERFLPLFTEQIRSQRQGILGKLWKVDDTFVRLKGEWCYLDRGIDEYGNLVNVRLSKTGDMAGTKAFFARARKMADDIPERVQTDGLASYPRAVEEELGEAVEHEVLPSRANAVEQSPRGIKQRYYPLIGFGEFEAAQRFCQAFDEVRNFLRACSRMTEVVSLNERTERFLSKVSELEEVFLAA